MPYFFTTFRILVMGNSSLFAHHVSALLYRNGLLLLAIVRQNATLPLIPMAAEDLFARSRFCSTTGTNAARSNLSEAYLPSCAEG